MKAVKVIFIGILVLLASVFAFGFLLPDKAHVERSIQIDRSADNVFPFINSLKQFNKWSPWANIDPNSKVDFFGPDEGVGAGMNWDSKDKRVGKGTQKITQSEINRFVATELSFDDGKSGGIATFEIQPNEKGVMLTWGFDIDFGMNPVMRYFGLMMDDMLGKSYEQGLATLKALVESQPDIQTEVINYSADGTPLVGYLAYPKNAKNAPGILVVHEWWGHNDYARKRAEMLAAEGYVAFALDMYGEGKSTGHPKEANAFMTEVIQGGDTAMKRFLAAHGQLKQNPMVDDQKIGAIGYCFGGAVVLSMARAGVDLAGVASFHGALQGLAPIAEGVDTKAIVFNGADDPFITKEQIAQFRQDMDSAGIDYEFIDYPGALHAFTNPAATAKGEEYGIPLKYDEKADKDSWKQMKAFFRTIF